MIPRSFKLFGHKYKVKKIKKLVHPDGEVVAGYINKQKRIVYINSSLDKETQLISFFHEMFHAVFGEVSLDQAISNELEEIVVDSHAKAVVEFFKDRIKLTGRGKR